ncbi:TonB-dependent receptor plug domain-containing protein, partial [Henriciella pelagia]
MKKYKRACLLAGTAATLMTVWSAAHAQTGEDAPEAETRRLNQVVVTALRREETLKDTPIAVSAYDGEQLGRERVEDFADIALQSPNVQFGANGGNTNIAIRGIGTNLQTAGNDPGVAFNLDGIYVADPALALSTLLDVKRVEVLRGPQGTLFGRNATGGAVNVISNTPTTTASYGFNTSVSAPLGVQADAFASGPLVDSGKLLGRIAVQKIYREGDVENTAFTGPDHLNDQDSLSARAQLE